MSDLANRIVDEIINGNNVGAKEAFDAAISSKLIDVMDARKIEVAKNFFKKQEEEPLDTQSETVTDES